MSERLDLRYRKPKELPHPDVLPDENTTPVGERKIDPKLAKEAEETRNTLIKMYKIKI